jgi:hypothetical protein
MLQPDSCHGEEEISSLNPFQTDYFRDYLRYLPRRNTTYKSIHQTKSQTISRKAGTLGAPGFHVELNILTKETPLGFRRFQICINPDTRCSETRPWPWPPLVCTERVDS